MRLRMLMRVSLISALLMVLTSNLVSAKSWIERKTEEVLTTVARSIFEPLLDGMVNLLGWFMSTPSFNDPDLKFVKTVMHDMQILAVSLLVLTLVFRIWRFQTSSVFGGQQESLPEILYKGFISLILIFGLPEILNLFMRLNDILIQYVSQRGVNLTEGLKAIAMPANSSIITILAIGIFVVALVFLTVSNAIRIAELCLLYVFAPIMAVSHAGKGESFQIWIAQAIAVSLTQSVQFYLVGLSLNFLGNIEVGQWWTFIAPIGAVVISIRGPALLKQYLYSSGVGGFATGTAQSIGSSAIYAKMMKVGK